MPATQQVSKYAPYSAQDKLNNLTADQQQDIFSAIANGDGYEHIAKQAGIAKHSLISWLASDEQATNYARANKLRAISLVDSMRTTAEDDSKDTLVQAVGRMTSNPSAVARSKLRCDVYKWQAQVCDRVQFGDKATVEHDVAGPLAAFLQQIQAQGSTLPIGQGRTIEHDDL